MCLAGDEYVVNILQIRLQWYFEL